MYIFIYSSTHSLSRSFIPDAAKKEADELYSRLLQDTHNGIQTRNQSAEDHAGSSADKWTDKYGEPPESQNAEEDGWISGERFVKSYEEPASFLSEQDASIVREENIMSIEEVDDGSDNEDF